MSVKVVDASALAAILFGESEQGEVVDRLRGAALIAPDLLDYEVASTCLKKIRLSPDRREALLEAFALRGSIAIKFVDIDHLAVVELAHRTGLSSYDASYLYLAMQEGAELVSLDRRLLAAAAQRRG
jgi:predicted nucleic acid-binding protein